LEKTVSDESRGERLQVMLTDQELKALDDWRFMRRMPSRAAAVRELLKRGLAAEGFLSAESGSRSRDYGVIDDGDGADGSDGADGAA
jgi:metal-responsive CopG/Arc/MetJ family transcriptional regulator